MSRITFITAVSSKQILMFVALAVTFTVAHGTLAAAQPPVVLGAAANFAVLGASTTTTGDTTVNGDLGVSPGTALTGNPTVYGTIHLGDSTAAQAQNDLTTAYNDAAGRALAPVNEDAADLGNQTLAPGLYKSASSLEISSGNLTLDAGGDTNAVWIFQMVSTLITTTGCNVILTNGAQAANVFWQVGSSATLGTSSDFKGNILAITSITISDGATLEGRALARNGAVTLYENTVTAPNAVLLVSAAAATGSYTNAVGQLANLATKTITVPMSGDRQFYRIRSDKVLVITGISISGGNVVITYN